METLSEPRTGRATPLPPDERRAAILRAVRPVLLERGVAVTSRELAEAAGVAEGTLFRVFTDKLTLMREAVLTAIDPAASVPELAAIDRSLPLRARMAAVLVQGLARVDDSVRWMGLLHEISRLEPGPAAQERAAAVRLWGERQRAGTAAVNATIRWLLEPDADQFRLPLDEVIELLTTVLLGTSMRTIDAARGGVEMSAPNPDRLADLVLHGVLADGRAEFPAEIPAEGSPRC